MVLKEAEDNDDVTCAGLCWQQVRSGLFSSACRRNCLHFHSSSRIPCRLLSSIPSGLAGWRTAGVWHFTLRFTSHFAGSWVGDPC